MERDDLVKAVEDRMGWFAGGYAYGLVGEANIEWLKDQPYADLFWFGTMYRLGACAMLHSTVEDWSDEVAQKLVEFLDDTAGLEDYPIIEDDYLNAVVEDREQKYWADLEADNNLDGDAITKVIDRDYPDLYFEWEQDYVFPNFDEQEFVDAVRKEQQTWNAHYSGTLFHDDTVCGYCAEASVSA